MGALEFNMEAPYIVGVDLGGTTLTAGVVTREGEVVCTHQRPTEAERGPEVVIGNLVEAIEAVLSERGLSKSDVAGVGIGVPGHILSEEGVCVFSPNFVGWRNVKVTSPIEERVGLKVTIMNDVNTAALGEWWFGAGKGTESMVMLTLGTGIGGGVIVNGDIVLGHMEAAGEVGHQTILPEGPRCGCGNHGCIEAIAARDAIVGRALLKLQQGRKSILPQLVGGDLKRLDPKIIEDAARMGDEVAREVYEETGYYLGIAVSNLALILDPELIVIGGAIAKAGDLIFEPIRRTVAARCQMTEFDPQRIVPAQLGELSGVVGGAVLVMRKLGMKRPS